MKKLISLLATLFILVASTSSSFKTPSYLDSIKPLVWSEEGETQSFPHCTTFRINSEKHYWLTAAHCINERSEVQSTIDNRIVKVLKLDREKDLALLLNTSPGPDLQLSTKSPEFGDSVHTIGYINGESFPFLLHGRVANPNAKPLQANGRSFMIMDMTTGGGNSGGPVLNENNQVISVVEVGFGGGMGSSVSPISGGILYDSVKEFSFGYWR